VNRDDLMPVSAADLAGLGREMMAEVRPRLVEAALSGHGGETPNARHMDNFLSEHDLWMHRRYRERLSALFPSFVYASEEADPEVIGAEPDPDLCVLVDPLDTSELAVRALYGYTHVLVYSRRLARPVMAVVGDIFHHVQLYVAVMQDDGADKAFVVTADSAEHVLRVRRPKVLSSALVTNYLMRPMERFLPLARQRDLMVALGAAPDGGKATGRIGVDFGSVGLCHVAAGFSDAMIEFAKGFAIWDLSPGHYVLHAAGGTVVDLDGRPVPLDYQLGSLADIGSAMDRRQKFIAAADPDLAYEILGTLRLH
jgi:myo-inositol-1(or 4)-monophosphatase